MMIMTMIIIIIIINAKRSAAPFDILSITNKSQHSCKKGIYFFVCRNYDCHLILRNQLSISSGRLYLKAVDNKEKRMPAGNRLVK